MFDVDQRPKTRIFSAFPKRDVRCGFRREPQRERPAIRASMIGPTNPPPLHRRIANVTRHPAAACKRIGMVSLSCSVDAGFLCHRTTQRRSAHRRRIERTMNLRWNRIETARISSRTRVGVARQSRYPDARQRGHSDAFGKACS